MTQSKWWWDSALEMRKQGKSSRQIAKDLFGKSSMKSSVNYFFNKYDAENKDVSSFNSKLKIKDNILFYDIETSLSVSYHWNQWGENLSNKQKIHESHLLSHAWAWGNGEIEGTVLSPEEAKNRDPERLVLEAWALLDNCDVLVAHNGKKYDVRKVNAYFLQYGLPPPSPYKVVDTLRIAKSKFALPFNSLDYLAKFLGVEQKIETSGIDLWIKCSQGDNEALRTLLEYNVGDIKTLRDVYEKLIAWDNQAANMAVYNDDSDALCPHCGSDDIKSLEGKFAHTMNRKYHLYRCGNCSATLRGNTSESKVNKFVRVI